MERINKRKYQDKVFWILILEIYYRLFFSGKRSLNIFLIKFLNKVDLSFLKSERERFPLFTARTFLGVHGRSALQPFKVSHRYVMSVFDSFRPFVIFLSKARK
jgi:hypothetical protein